jgi:hypothetical protein
MFFFFIETKLFSFYLEKKYLKFVFYLLKKRKLLIKILIILQYDKDKYKMMKKLKMLITEYKFFIF